MPTYSEKLKDPRWQKKRLEVLKRDQWMCGICGDTEKTLHVHHKSYVSGGNPWDSPMEKLATLCDDCHTMEKDAKQEFLALADALTSDRCLMWLQLYKMLTAVVDMRYSFLVPFHEYIAKLKEIDEEAYQELQREAKK